MATGTHNRTVPLGAAGYCQCCRAVLRVWAGGEIKVLRGGSDTKSGSVSTAHFLRVHTHTYLLLISCSVVSQSAALFTQSTAGVLLPWVHLCAVTSMLVVQTVFWKEIIKITNKAHLVLVCFRINQYLHPRNPTGGHQRDKTVSQDQCGNMGIAYLMDRQWAQNCTIF